MKTPAELASDIQTRLSAAADEIRRAAEAVGSLSQPPVPAGPAGGPAAEPQDTARLQAENAELSSRLAEAEEMNAAMMNMYVSSYQLHGTLEPAKVVEIIHEIIINFVGAEEFAVLVRDEVADHLVVASGEEAHRHYPEGRAPMQGVLGAVMTSGEPFVHTEPQAPREGILAAVPLANGPDVVGAVVIFKLLPHKAELLPSDVELMHLLSTHAATALINANQHARVERKQRTLQGLLGILTGDEGSAPGSGAD